MKFPFRLAAILFGALTLASGSAFGAATLQMSLPFINGIASNFANSLGQVRNGMVYGILVSTNGSSFAPGTYDPMSASVFQNGGFLTSNGALTDIYYHPGGNPAVAGSGLTSNSSGFIEGGGAAGANGTIENITLVPISPDQPTSPISSNDKFGLIWFSTDSANLNDYYGFFSHSSFVMPAVGDVDFSGAFVGADPIRSANFQFALVPEPSRALLLLAGVVGLGVRRRR